jgi:hypothetical protein
MIANRTSSQRFRRCVGVCTVAVTVAAAVLLVPEPVQAYHPFTSALCTELGWEGGGTPRIVLHVAEFLADGRTGIEQDQLIDAIVAVNVQFDQVGGTTADIGTILVSADPFTYTVPYGDTTPTLHIGFMDDPTYRAEAGPVGAVTVFSDDQGEDPVDADSDRECYYTEAHMRFNLPSTTDWNFGTPGTYYFQAGSDDSAGDPYFRQTYLHELLHAFGLDHADNTYSFLNYGDRPWANRSADEQIMPLPDEIRWLRKQYPAPTRRADAAVLNTWFDRSDVGSEGAAEGRLLCQPGRGAFDADPFATRCGDQRADASVVCDGDKLRVRFALANYSTATLNAVVQLYFSYDLTLDLNYDRPSGDWYVVSPPAAHSGLFSYTFTVPEIVAVPGTPYWPMIRITASADTDGDGSIHPTDETRYESIPLTAAVHTC